MTTLFTAGQLPTADELNFLVDIYAEKAADESVTSSATVQDDDHLAVTMQASCTYTLDYWLVSISASDTPDFKMGWTLPSGATMDFGAIGLFTTVAASTAGSVETQAVLAATTPTATISYGAVNGNTIVIGRGRVITSTTPGTLQLQWAQATSNATATTLKKGSWIKIRRVA